LKYIFTHKFQLTIKIWFIVAGSIVHGYSQNKTIDFEKYSVEHGLSNLSVHSLLQDSQGFIWIGTQGGLSRFDGYKFINFYCDPFDSTTLNDNFINCLSEGKDGTIWVGTRKGISNLDKKTNKVKSYSIQEENSLKKLHDFITTIYEDKNGNLWLGTKGGLLYFDVQKKKFTEIELNEVLPPKENIIRVNDIKADNDGNLWIGTTQGLYFHNPSHKMRLKKYSDSLNIKKICLDGNYIWMGASSGIYRIQTGVIINKDIAIKVESFEPYCMMLNHKNELLVGTLAGVKRYDQSKSQFVPFFQNDRVVSWYQSNRPQAIIEDNNQTYWIATFSDGLYHYDPGPTKFQHYQYEKDNPYSLNENSVYGLCEVRNGDLWVGTSTDLNILEKETGKFVRFSNTPTGMIWEIYQDSEGVIWAGGRNGLIKKTPDGKTQFYKTKSSNNTSAGRVGAIYEDHKKVLWFGGRDGLYTLVKKSGTFKKFDLPILTIDSLIINHLEEDLKKNLWIATNYGLYRMDANRDSVKLYTKNEKDKTTLSDNNFSGILITKSGEVYASSINYGLNQFNANSETFKHFSTKDGLPDEKIWGLTEDHHGFIWLSTSKGVSRFDPKNKTFRNFDIQDGLQSFEFNNTSFHKGRYSNKIFFGGINGFNAFHPDSIQYNLQVPNPVFTSIKYRTGNNNLTDLKEVPNIFLANKIRFPANTEIISVEFSALNFRQSFKNKYKYILKGVNQNWIDLGFKPEVSFVGLSYGSYELKVLASNNDGKWTSIPLELNFTILPKWWQTIWFKILLLALGVVLIRLIIQYNIKKRLEIENVRTQIASDLHDEVGSLLSGLAMQSELLLIGDGKENTSRLQNISTISRSVIGRMRDLVWSIDSRRDNMNALIEKMEDQAAEMFHPLDIGFDIQKGAIDYNKRITVFFRQHIFMLFNEAITNIIRHSNATFVQIRVGNFDNNFELSIHDNGNVVKTKAHISGMGMSNMKMRTEKLGGKLTITSDNGYFIKLILNKI
jgi:two-component system, sensor histidine kinase ChiS